MRYKDGKIPYDKTLIYMRPKLADEWHPSKNGEKTPETVSAFSNYKAWWYIFYYDHRTEKIVLLEWQEKVSNRSNGNGCPYLTGKQIKRGFNDLATTHPALVSEWDWNRNGTLTPYDVSAGSTKRVFWKKKYKDKKTGKTFTFEWDDRILDRTQNNNGCPYLSGHRVWKGYNDLLTTHPEIAAEWHPTKNGTLTPQDVTACSAKKVYWLARHKDSYTGEMVTEEWKASVRDRTGGNSYPSSKESHGEKFIKRYLKKKRLKFSTQKRFPELTGDGKKPMSFDFFVDGGTLIEYQGIQHYAPVNYFGGEEKFERQKNYDEKKRLFAKEKGLNLIEVPYTCDTYKKVEAYLDKCMQQEQTKRGENYA